jgi:3-hydroxyacyl-CoA dehydrogenase / enoyl-CoA hydratase / 3-hydroxybutyryl-CoA epimerase
MAGVLSRPQLFVGLHFFNPVARLPLVEVISGKDTSTATAQRTMSFVTQIGKLPLPCRSAPGFLVNRILAPYMLEALVAHEQGHALEEIDAVAETFGMPVGPIELADRVGLDVAQHVSAILSDVTGLTVPESLRLMVSAGHLGAKTGQGFYRYENDRAVKQRRSQGIADPDLEDRLMLMLLNEAIACYDEGVVDDYDLLDAGVVFGTGFAPFRGGPLHYARARGIENVVSRLRELEQRYGPRFSPHPGWAKVEQ